MTMILDGYNVIHAVPELAQHLDRSLQSAREALVRLCQDYRRARGDIGRVYVVFDGRAAHASGLPAADLGGVAVLFTEAPEEADERILRVIEDERGRGRCVVVSNDNEVFNNARAFGARIISAQAFYKSIRPSAIDLGVGEMMPVKPAQQHRLVAYTVRRADSGLEIKIEPERFRGDRVLLVHRTGQKIQIR